MKAFWLVPVVMLVVGCSQQDVSHVESDAQSMAKSAGQAASSLTLAGKVNSVLRLMKKIDKSSVHVDAIDGTVTLSGSVIDEDQRKFVLDTANGVVGVDKVVDHMVIAKS